MGKQNDIPAFVLAYKQCEGGPKTSICTVMTKLRGLVVPLIYVRVGSWGLGLYVTEVA